MLSLQHSADAQHQAQQTAALDGAGGGGVDWLGFTGRVDLKAHVKHCGSVPLDVRDYFHRDLDRTTQNKKARQWELLLREEVATERNVIHNIESDNDEKLQRAIHISTEEAQYARRVRQQGGQYEQRGGSSQQQPSGGLFDKLKRSTSR
jgi:hypothetical protein